MNEAGIAQFSPEQVNPPRPAEPSPIPPEKPAADPQEARQWAVSGAIDSEYQRQADILAAAKRKREPWGNKPQPQPSQAQETPKDEQLPRAA